MVLRLYSLVLKNSGFQTRNFKLEKSCQFKTANTVRTLGRCKRRSPSPDVFMLNWCLCAAPRYQTSASCVLLMTSFHLRRYYEQDALFWRCLFFFPPLSNSNLLVSFLDEVLASGLHSRSKETSQVTSRSASRRWNGDGEVSRMVELPLLRRCRLSPLTRGVLEKSLGFCACCYNPHPGSLLIPELLAQTPRLPVMSWEEVWAHSNPLFSWFLYQINKCVP